MKGQVIGSSERPLKSMHWLSRRMESSMGAKNIELIHSKDRDCAQLYCTTRPKVNSIDAFPPGTEAGVSGAGEVYFLMYITWFSSPKATICDGFAWHFERLVRLFVKGMIDLEKVAREGKA